MSSFKKNRTVFLYFGLLYVLHLCFDYELDMIIFMVCNCKLDEAIPEPSQRSEMVMKLDVLTNEPHTLSKLFHVCNLCSFERG